MAPKIDFWITCGSTYSYLSVMRLSDVERAHDVTFKLRPFYLGKIFDDLGRWPFPDGAEKTRYMWRDIERRAALHGLSPRLPAPYPAPNAVLANQVAFLALQQPWGRRYLISSYKHWFEDGMLPGNPDNLSASLSDVGKNVTTVLEATEKDRVHDRLVEETEIAKQLGIFGAPTFVVDRELFWGDDRIEDAATWARSATQ